tara:strand:- start:870 stop:1223 length:354 start_codon:yes stop_codon:yes gene_type:complete
MKHYDGGYLASLEDFYTDLNRVKYIKKLVTRYTEKGNLKERLILNHIIVLNNMFGPVATARILYFRVRDDFHIIKPFLVLLNTLPQYYRCIGNDLEQIVDTDLISMDTNIIEALRQI